MSTEPNNERLLSAVKRMVNLVLILIIVIVLMPILWYNSDTIMSLFTKEKMSVTAIPSNQDNSEIRQEASTYFKSISYAPKPSLSKAKIDLGMKLYYDKRLSKDGNISCNSCHNLNTFGVDNLPTSPGDLGELGGRNSPTVIYASLHANQFWDGRAKDVEEQAGMPILNPVEHNIPSEAFLVERLRGIEEYQTLFREVFNEDAEPITYPNLTEAIGAFERQLNPKSRFDEWLDGNDNSMTQEELKGLQSFIDNGCVACHSGVTLGGQMMQKFGVYGNYWDFTKSTTIDNGVFDLTQNENDKYVFKVPSLRNIEKTYPYFHDGSVEDLKEAVKIMHRLQNNKYLNDRETENIVAFLKTLTADVDDRYKQ